MLERAHITLWCLDICKYAHFTPALTNAASFSLKLTEHKFNRTFTKRWEFYIWFWMLTHQFSKQKNQTPARFSAVASRPPSSPPTKTRAPSPKSSSPAKSQQPQASPSLAESSQNVSQTAHPHLELQLYLAFICRPADKLTGGCWHWRRSPKTCAMLCTHVVQHACSKPQVL